MKYPDDYINKIICGDCLEVMKGIPDKSVDLVLTDPPYGIGICTKGKVGVDKPFGSKKERFIVGNPVLTECKDYGKQEWDFITPTQEYFNEILRVSKVAIIFGGNYFTDKLPPAKCWICWDKQIPKGFTKAQIELCWTNSTTYSRLYSVLWNGMIRDRSLGNEIRFHPTQKPTSLLKMILNDFSKPNDLILDSFAGSFSTAVACIELKRRYIAIEIDKKYCEIGQKRIDNTTIPML